MPSLALTGGAPLLLCAGHSPLSSRSQLLGKQTLFKASPFCLPGADLQVEGSHQGEILSLSVYKALGGPTFVLRKAGLPVGHELNMPRWPGQVQVD